VPACPVEAIFALDEVPEKWKDYIDKNTDFFKQG
jgi:ferredoxin